jgi:DNA-directed RNA polymerase specialized sigma24 family protein
MTLAQGARLDHRPGDRLVALALDGLPVLVQQRLPVQDRRLIALYVQEGSNYSAVARLLGRDSSGIRDRYHRLFRRIRAAMA